MVAFMQPSVQSCPQTVVVRCAATVHAANKRLYRLSRAKSELDADI